MKTTRLFILLILVICCFRENFAQISSTEKQRIERLGGLAKVWGAVKYFHPYPGYRDIDLDKALIETIPRVNAAKSPQEYSAAINHLLSFLNDPQTFAQVGDEVTSDMQTTVNKTEFVRLLNDVLIINVVKIAEAGAVDQSAVQRIFPQITSSLPKAKAVLFDCRASDAVIDSGAAYEYFFDGILRSVLPLISDKPINLGASRFRMHNGYTPQTGIASGGYYSGMIQTPGQAITGQSKNSMRPVGVVFNKKTQTGSLIFTAMLSMDNILTVEESESSATDQSIGGSSTRLALPNNITVKIRTTENINPDGTLGFSPDITLEKKLSKDEALTETIRIIKKNAVTYPKQKLSQKQEILLDGKEKTYPEMTFPSSEYRLLALFRFWNVVNYFYPYKNLIGDSWQTVLPRYIVKLEAATDAADYQMIIRELITELHDSHGVLRNAAAADEKLGTYYPPFLVRTIENKTIVSKIMEENLPLQVGDVILMTDGEPVEKRREYLARYNAASTPQALMYIVDLSLLRGQKDAVAKLTVRGADGKTRDVEIPRSLSRTDPKLTDAANRTGETVQILTSGYGYVDLQKISIPEVEPMFVKLKDAPAIIFDMRGYPQGTAWEIASHLTEKKNMVAALFSRPYLEASKYWGPEETIFTSYSFEQTLPAPKPNTYKGKVVVLIDESAISQAEHLCLFLEAATDVTFIGTPTRGANGDVSNVILPGNIAASFSGHNVRHGDGRQLQRIGIQPTVRVAPTIRGITANRDEILEAAVKFLKSKK